MTGLRDWASLLAAIGTLSLAVIAARAGRSPLARSLAALCIMLFGWNIAVLAQRLVRASPPFAVLDAVSTALSPPLVLEVVLAFVGGAARARTARRLAWVGFGGLALASLGGLASREVLAWIDAPSWSIGFLAGWALVLAFEVQLLVRHLRTSLDAREKARTRVVLAALAFGGVCGASDAARAAGLPSPYLGAIGTFVAAALLLTLVVRLDLFDRRVSVRTSLYAIGMISTFVVAYLVVLSAFVGRLGVQLFCACLLTVAGAAVARELATSIAEARARTQHLALVGRFSAQMTHDIKGPLTALLGAVQLLEGEQGEDAHEYRTLVAEQAKRIGAIVDRYDRMARVEPRMTLVAVNGVARSVARAHGVADLELTAGDPEIDADAALLESALENIVRNAVEATNDPALVRVVTEADELRVAVAVVDRGPGMDARVLARATEDLFTTKAGGSGLGLAFTRRVAEAHGGTLTLTSRTGEGTRVEIALPRTRVSASPP